MTVALPHFEDDDARRANFEALLRRLIDTGGLSVGMRFGTKDATFSAASNTGNVTVTHGLAKTPAYLNVFPTFGTVSVVPNYISGSRNATTFQFRLDTRNGSAISATLSCFWIVIG